MDRASLARVASPPARMKSLRSTGGWLAHPEAAGRDGAPKSSSGSADLWILAALLALTATFGKGFSMLGFPDASIYVTEIGLAASGGLALLRLGPRRLAGLIRSRVPLVPFAFFWLAALVATFEGLRSVGVTNTLEDIGLAEYSLLLPLLAAVANTLYRVGLLTRLLVFGLVGGTLVYGFSDLSVRLFEAEGTFFDVQEITFGLYMSMLVGYVAARLSGGSRSSRWWAVLGAIALVLVFLTNARGVWISVVVALAAVSALAPTGMRVRTGLAACTAVLCAVGLAIGIQMLGGASQIANEVTGAVRGIEAESSTGPEQDSDGPESPREAGLSESEDNARWRIDFWQEIVSRSVDRPVFGVGFGEPIAFRWDGQKYDFRDGDPSAAIDVGGPHNEYLHILYRTGYVGLIALIALIAIALARTLGVLRSRSLDPANRALVVGLVAMWLATATVSFFADALKAPFLGLFFWSSLGLLLAAIGAARAEGTGGSVTSPVESGEARNASG